MAAVKPRTGSVNSKCATCGKTVYAMEMIAVEDKVFHKNGCLKCTHCSKTLSPGNYASMGGVYYCKPHFKQLFALKGNYDEGFGGEKHAKKWAPQVVAKFGGVEKVQADNKRASTEVSSGEHKAPPAKVAVQETHHEEAPTTPKEEHHEEPQQHEESHPAEESHDHDHAHEEHDHAEPEHAAPEEPDHAEPVHDEPEEPSEE